jgi:hypothetical protein
VRVGADHHAAGEGVVLEHHLVDDARSGPPEADAVARRGRAQEVVDLAVGLAGGAHVRLRTGVGLDQVIAVDGGGHCGGVAARQHELKQRHLGGGILHGHAVGARRNVALAGRELLVLGVVEVAEEDLLGVG